MSSCRTVRAWSYAISTAKGPNTGSVVNRNRLKTLALASVNGVGPANRGTVCR